MKKLLSLSLLLLLTVVAKATITFTMDNVELKPSEQKQVAINVANDVDLPGFEMKIFLPEGISFQGTTKAKRVKSSDRLEGFTVSGANQADGSYKIQVVNMDGDAIPAGEGAVVYLLIQADEDAVLGDKELKLGTVRYSLDNVLQLHDDVVSTVSVYKEFTISATSTDETMGAVVGGGVFRNGTTATLTATPAEGYHFVKWSDEATDNPYTVTVDADATLSATFAPNQYTVTFVLGNGEDNVVLTQDYGSALAAPMPVRVGYTFAGWDAEVPATVPLGDKTYTAQWTVNQYTITFDTDGGTAVEAITQDYATDVTAPAAPTKLGYTFAGWSPVVPATMPAENVTITAQWTINQYTITFDTDGGSAVAPITQDYNTAVTAPASPVKEGYTFSGWSPAVPATMPAENVTVTAQWTINQYTITFVLDNGEANVVLTQDYATAINAPAPEKEGFTFAGWDKTVPATMPAENVTLTAQWTRNSYAVTFIVDGVAVSEGTVDYEGTITAPADPVKEGYTFAGWSPAVPATMPASDQTFTAQWTVNQYAIIYMVGNEEWARDLVDYGTAIELRSYTAEEGYTFHGWISTDGEDYTTMPAHDITYTPNIVSAIARILAGVKTADVYDLSGRLVLRQAAVDKLKKQLPAGVYIIAGKKVVVK